jgi:enoyl-CoA hydratase/carnithine racemase
MAIAREIADNAPLAVQSIKRTIDSFAYRGMTEAMRFAAMSASIEFVSEDMPAGYAAKAAKRPIVFEGK